jgi:hypothetical protein
VPHVLESIDGYVPGRLRSIHECLHSQPRSGRAPLENIEEYVLYVVIASPWDLED